MQLSKILNKDANNLDIFRVIAACMVIYGHSYSLAMEPGHFDPIGKILGFDYAGTLAVKIFFFLSGLVVTNSLLEKRDPIKFAISRTFRIWPALIFVLVVTAFIMGPITTKLSVIEYLSNPEIYKYIYKNASMQSTYFLPGVFTENTYQNIVNGSLWTIPVEVSAYLILVSLFVLGVFKSKILPGALFLLVLIDPLIDNKLLFTWLPKMHEVSLVAPCFAFGALLAFYKEKITLDAYKIVAVWVLYFMFNTSTYNFYFFYLALFPTILYVSGLTWFVKFKPKIDLSYGIYLWGYPVQQFILAEFGSHGVRFNQAVSMAICFALAFISWHLIERRSIAFGAFLARLSTWKIQSIFANEKTRI